MTLRRENLGGVPLVDVLLGLLLVVGALATVAGQPWSARTAADLVVSGLTAGLVALRRRAPLVTATGFATGLLVLAAVGQVGTTTWAFVALLVVAFSITAELPRPTSTWSIGFLFVAALIYDIVRDHNGLGSVVSPVVIVGAPAAAGWLLHHSRAQADRLAALADELAAQRDLVHEAAALAERTRVAREIHDVVAHTVGVMVVQAAAAEKLLPPGHRATESVTSIRRTGKEAMQELRRVVGVLRTAEDETVRPQPGMDGLADLVDEAQRTCEVTTDIEDVGELPVGLGLTVYRTVQESLTNALRHAPGARVRVVVSRSGDRLTVAVDDDAGGVTSEPALVDPALDRKGFGLVGLAERASLYGGEFEAGPRPDRAGWRVCLSLPVVPSERTDAEVRR